jgi:hypothetical protein
MSKTKDIIDEALGAVELAKSEPKERKVIPRPQDITPCCNHLGKFSYASCSRPNKSLAVAALFARIAILTLELNNA